MATRMTLRLLSSDSRFFMSPVVGAAASKNVAEAYHMVPLFMAGKLEIVCIIRPHARPEGNHWGAKNEEELANARDIGGVDFVCYRLRPARS